MGSDIPELRENAFHSKELFSRFSEATFKAIPFINSGY